MPYFLTENFSAGIDTRKHPITAPAGTLRDLTNCHITPGGEIEKRLAFIEAFDVAGTMKKSLMKIGDVLYVVGTGADQTFGELTLRFISGPTITPTTEVLDWDIFDGKLYFVTFTPGDTKHWYQDAVDGNTASEVTEGKGQFIRTYRSKMYSVEGTTIYFSAVGDPTIWDTSNGGGTGQGFIDAAASDAEAFELHALEVYYDQLAVFSRRVIQFWNMDADPANNAQTQTIRSLGSASRMTPRQYGAGDIMFLSDNGIRSLQARDSSNSASVNDVGSPIDANMQAIINADRHDAFVNTRSMLENQTGRYWMSFANPPEIWVLSLFPGPKVSAWSRYLPTHTGDNLFTPEEMIECASSICVRSTTDKIYALGGADRATYDNCTASFQMPYLGFDKPAHWKQFLGFDAAVDGTWNAQVSFDPDNVVWEDIGTMTKSTFNDQRLAFRGYSPACSVKMTTTSASKARCANVALHYTLSKDD